MRCFPGEHLAKTLEFKPEEITARSYADRLILQELSVMESAIKLGELADRLSGAGLGLAAVRALLASNPDRFANAERRWIPASRVEGAGRSLSETIRLTVDRFGGPLAFGLLAQEVARTREAETSEIEETIRRVIEHDPQFILTDDERVCLSAWAFMATDEMVERALAIWKIDTTEFEDLKKKVGDLNWRETSEIEKALEKVAPVSAKTLGAVAWNALNGELSQAVLLYNGAKFFADLLSIPGYVYGADGKIYKNDAIKGWLTTAVKVAEKLAPTVDVEDAAPIEVKVDDVKKMIAKIAKDDATITATKLLEEFYEITPSNKTFPDDLANVMDALKGDPAVWWVGADRFRKAKSAPDFIYEVPEVFQYPESNFKNEEGELIDVELTDDGLSSTLRKLLVHPLATDVLDEDILPPQKQVPDRVRLVLKSIHRELGTFPMCQFPTGFFKTEPKMQEFIFVDSNGREAQVWANHEARLLYNLIEWWYEQPVESGAVFTITKTAKENVYDFAWEDQTDPVVYISSQRMEELRDIQGRSEDLSTLDILIEIMGHWPKGTDFLTLLAEVNVVRRSTRRLVASLLSSYQCFYQRSGSPLWHFDNKKVELGFDKTKKKFIRK